MASSDVRVAEGYTLVVCAGDKCRTERPGRTVAVLRDCVRASRHGVLVVSGCALGRFACRLRPAGPMVLVQPCDARRRPAGPVIRVGPLCGEEDLVALVDWVRTERFDPTRLPRHLVVMHRAVRAAAGN